MTEPQPVIPPKIPFISDKELEQIAYTVSSKRRNIPINVDLIAEKDLGLLMTPMPFNRNISGCEGFIGSDLEEIVYFQHPNNEPRVRFTIAHEIGHYILHAEYIKSLEVNSIEDWMLTIESLDSGVWSRAEYQANKFAAFLLVPIPELMDAIRTFKPKLRAAYKAGFTDPKEIAEYIAPGLAKQFCVSEEMIKIHMITNNIDPFTVIT